jgi:hypothetical protein
MLEELNRRLMDVKEKMRIKQKLLAAHNDLEQKLYAEKSRLDALANSLQKEGKDVKKLEGLSLTGLFLDILGSKEEQLEKERQEYLAAKLRFDQCKDSISALEEQFAGVKQKIGQLKDIDMQYEAVFREKENFVLHEGSAASQKVLRLSEEIADIQSNSRELKEAMHAGDAVLKEVNGVIGSLRSAQGWGTWDLVGGGLLSTAIKHSRVHDARDSVHRVQQKLMVFSRELKDVDPYLQSGVAIDIGGFASFADYFFDGLIVDWIVQSRIKNSLANAVLQRDKVDNILEVLKHTLAKSEQELERLKRERKSLIESM